MSIVTLNEQPINTDTNVTRKDGENLSNIQNLNVGSPGIGGTAMENGVWNYYDSSGNIVIQINPNG